MPEKSGNFLFHTSHELEKPTHIALSLALKACPVGLSIYFTTMEELIGKRIKKMAYSLMQ